MNKKQLAVIILTLVVIAITILVMPKNYLIKTGNDTAIIVPLTPALQEKCNIRDVILSLETKTIALSFLLIGIILFAYFKDKGRRINKRQLLICMVSIIIIASTLIFIPKNRTWHLENGTQLAAGESMMHWGGYNLFKNKPVPPYEAITLRTEVKIFVSIVLILGVVLVYKARDKKA